jgi:hypothetical protein
VKLSPALVKPIPRRHPPHLTVRWRLTLLYSLIFLVCAAALPGARSRVLSAERLLEQAWDENADPFTNTVKVTVARLRRKLGPPSVIHTTPGVGYRITRITNGSSS